MSEHSKMVQLIYQLVKAEYISTRVFKEQKITALLKKQKIRYEPDVHVLADNDKIDVYEVWLGETWEKAVTDLLHALWLEKLHSLGWINIIVVNMHRKYASQPKRTWTKDDVERIRRFLIPLLNEELRNHLQNKLRIVEILEDELKSNKLENLRKRLKLELI